MPRLRALFAILLAVTWCSAVWHVDLEAVGLIMDHHHHAHHESGDGAHAPANAHDEHDPVLVRGVVKDGELRVGGAAVLWFALVGVFVACAIDRGRDSGEREPIPIYGRTAPPFQQIWQFVQRCAPEAAAPPMRA